MTSGTQTAGLAVRLGAMLRSRREELGLSQAFVAEIIGHTQAWLSNIEAGKREPRLADLDALLRGLNVEMRITPRPLSGDSE